MHYSHLNRGLNFELSGFWMQNASLINLILLKNFLLFQQRTLMALFHCVVWLGTARLVTAWHGSLRHGTARFGLVRFSTGYKKVRLFQQKFRLILRWLCWFKYSWVLCRKFSDAVMMIFSGQSVIRRIYTSSFGNGTDRLEPRPRWC